MEELLDRLNNELGLEMDLRVLAGSDNIRKCLKTLWEQQFGTKKLSKCLNLGKSKLNWDAIERCFIQSIRSLMDDIITPNAEERVIVLVGIMSLHPDNTNGRYTLYMELYKKYMCSGTVLSNGKIEAISTSNRPSTIPLRSLGLIIEDTRMLYSIEDSSPNVFQTPS